MAALYFAIFLANAQRPSPSKITRKIWTLPAGPHETTRRSGDRRLPAPVAPPPARDRSRATHRLTCAPLRQFTPDGAEAAIGVDPVQRPRVVAGERRLGQHSDDALFRQPTARGTHAAAPGVWTQGHVPSPCYGFSLPCDSDWEILRHGAGGGEGDGEAASATLIRGASCRCCLGRRLVLWRAPSLL